MSAENLTQSLSYRTHRLVEDTDLRQACYNNGKYIVLNAEGLSKLKEESKGMKKKRLCFYNILKF